MNSPKNDNNNEEELNNNNDFKQNENENDNFNFNKNNENKSEENEKERFSNNEENRNMNEENISIPQNPISNDNNNFDNYNNNYDNNNNNFDNNNNNFDNNNNFNDNNNNNNFNENNNNNIINNDFDNNNNNNDNNNNNIPENPVVESIYNKKATNQNFYIMDSNVSHNNIKENIYNNNRIENTQMFMQQIDLRCDDHVQKFKKDFQATRYCSKCRSLCCDSCVIDYHISHINEAQTRIEDYFRSKRIQLDELRAKINNSIKMKINENEINKIIDDYKKTIESYFSRRKNRFNEMSNKINLLINEDEKIHKKLVENIEIFYKDEGYKKLEKPLKENEILLEKVKNFLNDWDNKFSKTDKVNYLKQNVFDEFENDSVLNMDLIKNNTDAFKGKTKTVEKKIEEILKILNNGDKLNDFDKIFDEIKNINIATMSDIDKIKYDEIVGEKVEQMSKEKKEMILNNFNNNNNNNNSDFNLMNNQKQINNYNNYNNNLENNGNNFYNNNNNNNNNNYMNNQLPLQPYNNNNNNNNNNNIQDVPYCSSNIGGVMLNPFGNSENNNNNNNNMMMNNNNNQNLFNQNLSNTSKEFNFENLYDYEIFISIRPKSNELIIFNPENGFSSVKINMQNFQNQSDFFQTFPDNAKYVNLSSSILLTGGYINKQLSRNCYLFVLGKMPNNPNQYEVNIMSYGKMIEARERHNIVYLPGRNIVLVCSGFFNKGSEYTNINQGEWKSAGQMNDIRGNATITYVNERYVYVIGGYKVPEKQHNGVYLGNCEYLDFDNLGAGWNLINFGDNNLKLSAMGVLPIGTNNFFLCGGFDGQHYKKEMYRVNCNDKDNLVIEKSNLTLPYCYIFLHNNFLKIGNYSVNLELSSKAVIFDYYKLSFNVKNFE